VSQRFLRCEGVATALHAFCDRSSVQRCIDIAGADIVDADTLRAQVSIKREGQAVDASLAGTIGDRATADGHAGLRAHEDDDPMALLDHDGCDLLHDEEGALEVDPDDAVPRSLVEVDDISKLAAHDARGADQDIHAPEHHDSARHGGRGLVRTRDIGSYEGQVMARSRRRSCQLGPSLMVHVEHDDASAALREELPCCPADARSAAGEDHSPSLDIRHRFERSTTRGRQLARQESSTLPSMNSSDRARPVAFGHVGLHVSDIERSIRYYRDIIGLEEVERRVREDEYLGVLTGYPDVRLDTCLLVDPASGIMFELLVVLSASGTPAEPATANPGTVHICFVVDDVDAIYRRAIASGHEAVNEPLTPTAGRWKDGRSVYLLDPDRIRVELVQPGDRA